MAPYQPLPKKTEEQKKQENEKKRKEKKRSGTCDRVRLQIKLICEYKNQFINSLTVPMFGNKSYNQQTNTKRR